MSVIRVLPENLANQIAAGEVVERPASVVKELLENAVDAGAGRIGVQVAGGGTALIRVIDDGCGMDGDDLLLCLERHATSKIRDSAGLGAIRTLGFRGEALPSIASVSRLRLLSRPAAAPLGSVVEVSFGTVRKVLEAGGAVGTSIEVRDLFGNVPARRKFLKTPRTELAHIEECVKNCALASPALGVHYQVEGRTILEWPAGVDDGAGRIARLYPGIAREQLLAVGELGDGGEMAAAGAIRVTGLLPLPEAMPATGGRLRVFVNGRPVRDRTIAHAVAEGLRHELARGRQPAGVLFIELDPALVDVNVHPTKQEIRFQRPARVHAAVSRAVAAAVLAHEQGRRRQFFGPGPEAAAQPSAAAAGERAAPQAGGQTGVAAMAADQRRLALGRVALKPAAAGSAGAGPMDVQEAPAASEAGRMPAENEPLSALAPPAPLATANDFDGTLDQPFAAAAVIGAGLAVAEPVAVGLESAEAEVRAGLRTAAAPQPEPWSEAVAAPVAVTDHGGHPDASGSGMLAGETGRPRLLGQVLNSYILCESGGALLAVDQHAAHERLLFERLLGQFAGRGLASQALLFPVMLELGPAEAAVLESRSREIARLGLELTDFGGGSYLIKAVPALLGGARPDEVAAAILARFQEDGERGGHRATLDGVLADMACKAAVKAGQRLESAEMESLLAEMAAAGLFSRCPHGRPVVRRFGPEEMKKWFHR